HQCEAGRDNYCAAGKNLGVARHGGYADRILVPDAKYLVDITGLDPSWAATLEALGHKRICVVDVSSRNLDIARELGASDVVQPGDKASKQILEACGG